MLRAPQLAHVPVAVVISVPKTATRVPAIAFPSSASMGLASGGRVPFGGGLEARQALRAVVGNGRAGDFLQRAVRLRPVPDQLRGVAVQLVQIRRVRREPVVARAA